MKIKVTKVAPMVLDNYRYYYRVEIFDTCPHDEIDVWLTVNDIQYTRTSSNIYYLGAEETTAFVLKWA